MSPAATVINFNGDDTVLLLKNDVVIDAIGQLGVDPGTEWGTGDTSTQDATLRRKTTVTSGDADASNAFDPAVEWDGFAINTLDGLGGYPDEVVEPPPGACDEPVTATIPQIQGSGAASPLAGQTVTTRGVVTADTQGSSGLNGFFLQDAAGDADTLTSDGVFVFVPSANPLASVNVAVGDEVAVIGRATEFNTLTEIDFVTALEVCGLAAVPTATAYNLPEPSNGDLERVEGMLVSIPQTLTVQQNFFLGRFGQLTLGSGGRLFTPTNIYPAGSPEAVDLADQNQRALLVLDDGTASQNPNPIPYIGEDQTNRAGDTVSGLVGVVDYGSINSNSAIRDYRLHPSTPPSFERANDRTDEPEDVGGNLTVASFNVLNYFTTFGGLGRGANNQAEFDRQRAKIFSAMAAMDAGVLGLIEIENLPGTSAVANLVEGLNAYVGEPGRYAAIADPATGVGDDAIKVALIYQPGVVTPVGASASYVGSEFDLARPPVAQTFALNANGEQVTVVVNHFKSKNCDPEPSGGDVDSGDGQGCYNATRTAQATALAGFVSSLAATSRDPDVLVVGDLNAYAEEDPILALESAGLSDQIERFVGKDAAYSFVFDGQSGYLDHALASAALDGQVNDVTEWHINADEPSVIDYNLEFKPQDLYTPTPFRSSDHDPVVVGLDLGRCQFADDAAARVRTLLGDCSTAATLGVPDGWTFDGAGFTVSAYGGLSGAVVGNEGDEAYVRDLTIVRYAPDATCTAWTGVRLAAANGSVTGTSIDGAGCAEVVGVEVSNPSTRLRDRTAVFVGDNDISGTGAGVLGRGGTITGVVGNRISDNTCGIRVLRPAVVLPLFNTFSGNDQNVCRG